MTIPRLNEPLLFFESQVVSAFLSLGGIQLKELKSKSTFFAVPFRG